MIGYTCDVKDGRCSIKDHFLGSHSIPFYKKIKATPKTNIIEVSNPCPGGSRLILLLVYL